MISFSPRAAYSRSVPEELSDFLRSLEDEGCEVSLADHGGCILTRLFDGEDYLFLCPEPTGDDADLPLALDALDEYTVRLELPLLLTDVPEDLLPLFRGRYPDLAAEAADEEASVFCLRVVRPLDRLDDVPTLSDSDLFLDRIAPSDADRYAALLRATADTDYGFNALDGNEDADPRALVALAYEEFERHIALPFAVRQDGRLVGEVTLFAFDGKGGYEIAVRILPDARRRGIARRALNLAMRYARDTLHCPTPRAMVRATNAPSLALFSSLFEHREQLDAHTFLFTQKTT